MPASSGTINVKRLISPEMLMCRLWFPYPSLTLKLFWQMNIWRFLQLTSRVMLALACLEMRELDTTHPADVWSRAGVIVRVWDQLFPEEPCLFPTPEVTPDPSTLHAKVTSGLTLLVVLQVKVKGSPSIAVEDLVSWTSSELGPSVDVQHDGYFKNGERTFNHYKTECWWYEIMTKQFGSCE